MKDRFPEKLNNQCNKKLEVEEEIERKRELETARRVDVRRESF